MLARLSRRVLEDWLYAQKLKNSPPLVEISRHSVYLIRNRDNVCGQDYIEERCIKEIIRA